MVCPNKIHQSFINMKSRNTEIKLEMDEPSMRSATVSKPLGPEVLDNTSKSGVIELNARTKHNIVEVLF